MKLPTLDRIFMGMVAGAVVGGTVFEAGWALYFWQTPTFQIAILLPFVLCIVMPFVFAPLWLAAFFLGLRNWLGAALAGALFFLVSGMAWQWAISDYFSTPPIPPIGMLVLYVVVGTAIGITTWRVAYWNVGD